MMHRVQLKNGRFRSDQMENNIDPFQFSLFRIAIGVYLFFHFIFLYPFSAEMFGAEGMIDSPDLNPTNVLFPVNLLNWFDNELFLKGFMGVLIVLSLILIVGFKRRWTAAILLYAWIALFNRNNLTLTPGIAFIGWFLLVMVFIDEGEPFSLTKKEQPNWEMPQVVYAGAWLLMSLSYTLSGIDKLFSPSWVDGSAINKLLYSPLARDSYLVDILSNQSSYILMGVTYIVLLAELLFFPFALFSKIKPVVWTLMVLIHIGIIILMNISDIAICMLIVHVFTFNSAWLKNIRLLNNI